MKWTREGEQVWHSGKKRANLFFVYLRMQNGMWAMTAHCEQAEGIPVLGFYLKSASRCRNVAKTLRKSCSPSLKRGELMRTINDGKVFPVVFPWKFLKSWLKGANRQREPKSLK